VTGRSRIRSRFAIKDFSFLFGAIVALDDGDRGDKDICWRVAYNDMVKAENPRLGYYLHGTLVDEICFINFGFNTIHIAYKKHFPYYNLDFLQITPCLVISLISLDLTLMDQI
jgi:hypothetical protein